MSSRGNSWGFLFLTAFFSIALVGCQNPNEIAVKAGEPRPDASAIRQRETIILKGIDERSALVEATQVLLDLGFTIEESAAPYGVVTGAKNRDATEAGEVAGQIALTVLFAALGSYHAPNYDTTQIIRVTLATIPLEGRSISIRTSFERVVITSQQQVRTEPLNQPEITDGFRVRLRDALAIRGVS
jgi:hypothetical protein